MLTRRGFAGFASCALCAVTEFIATEASAQGAPAPTTPGVTRKILSKTDGPTAGYETLLVEAEIEAGVPVGRHTHPGVESAYILEGGFELPIQGQDTRMLKPGDGFQIPPNTPHAGGKPGTAKTKVLITYVVEKGKPLASPAPQWCPPWVCAVKRRRFSSGCKSHPATAPAGSNRSSHGGNEVAEASG